MKPILPTLFIALMLSACAASTPDAVATSATAAPAAEVAVAQVPAPMPAPAPAAAATPAPAGDLAAGQKAFEQGCFSCHDQATILAAGGRTRADWQDVVSMMQDRGFSGSPQEIKLIVDYLAATHPPKT